MLPLWKAEGKCERAEPAVRFPARAAAKRVAHHWEVLGERWQCTACLALSRLRVVASSRWRSMCPESNVTLSRILAARGNGNTLAADTAEEFRSARPFVICMRCGCYATTHARSLRNACVGAPRTGAGHAALQRTARRTDSSRCACIAKRWSLTEARRISIGTFVPNTCGAAQKCKKLFGRAVVDPSGYGRSAVRRCVSKRSLYSAECASADDQNKDTALAAPQFQLSAPIMHSMLQPLSGLARAALLAKGLPTATMLYSMIANLGALMLRLSVRALASGALRGCIPRTQIRKQ